MGLGVCLHPDFARERTLCPALESTASNVVITGAFLRLARAPIFKSGYIGPACLPRQACAEPETPARCPRHERQPSLPRLAILPFCSQNPKAKKRPLAEACTGRQKLQKAGTHPSHSVLGKAFSIVN